MAKLSLTPSPARVHTRTTRHAMKLAVARAFKQGQVPSNQDLRSMGLTGYRPCKTCGKPTRGDQCYKCACAEPRLT